MNTNTLDTLTDTRRSLPSARAVPTFRTPHFDTQAQDDALRIVVWVPGVDANGIEITTRDTDLTVTARKTQVVRRNWQALHLEGAQKDYQLNLRLGRNLNYEALRADLHDGVLTIDVPVLSRSRAPLSRPPRPRSRPRSKSPL